MKRCTVCFSFVLLCLFTFAISSNALDWPQWQGPDRDAISQEKGLLQEWPKDGPPLAWKVGKLGGGDSAPAIADGKIYCMSIRGGDEVVWALSEKDGSEIWTTPLSPAVNQRMPQSKEGPGCTPTVDGDMIYVIGMGGELACLQAKDGKIVWHKSFTKDFGGQVPAWSYRESVLVDGDKVICTPGGPDAMMVALNKKTGETIWKCAVPQPEAKEEDRRSRRGGGGAGAAYSSVIAIDFEGIHQYVQFTAKSVIGVSADGKFLWQFAKPANGMGINCSTPIYHDGYVFAASAYGGGGALAKLSKDADGNINAEVVYATQDMQSHHGGVILHDGCLYGANGGNEGGYLICLDFMTGKILWNERDQDKRRVPKGSVAFADNRLYFRAEDGAMLLIEPSAKEYLERGRFEQPDRTNLPAWAHPVIANGKLYLRDQDTLFCYNIKK
ncbi:PQQ-binding-like beta-propeller repeat protein [bacterium]|nr:PQQ-binding-like beta-propeller repeat protein [bacterium]